jgi:molybdenum cofactor guanylyltransferase
MMEPFTVAIIAGGKSSRMGTDKAFVLLAGKPIIEHIIGRVSDLGQAETILITNRPESYDHLKLPMYRDVVPDKGSLGGIYTAIHHSQHPFTLALSCDIPFVNPALLRHILSLRNTTIDGNPVDVVVPRVDKYPEGLHALYSKRCLEPIRERMDADRLNVIGFYPKVNVRYIDEPEYAAIDPHKHSFFNVNTPDELQQAEQIARQSG